MIEQIGKYKILEKIGQGAMGEVYKAHDPVLNRFVAVKTISSELGADDTLRKRFQREAQSAARLNHPNIITVYDYGEEQGKIYMAMELLDGSDLKQSIARRASLSLDDKLSVVDQIAEGLAFAHSHEIVHRDLKPANIHLLGNGQAKIMDFGLARLGGSEMTRTGMVMGTPHYMSPEQVRGERADARSDVFALGCVFYELLTYRKPFDADSMHSVLFKVMQEDPPPAHEVDPAVPAVLAQVVARAMAKDPSQRFQNASEFRSALHRAMQAVAAGQGENALPDLALPAGTPAARAGDATAGGSASRSSSLRGASASGARSTGAASRAPAPPPGAPSKAPLMVGGGLLLAALAIGGVMLGRSTTYPPVTSPPPATTAPAVDGLSQELARSQVELARRRADAGDFRDAVRQAERALKIDPANRDAQEILARSKATATQADAAAAAAQQAVAAGQTVRAADALWTLIGLEPANTVADEVAPKVEAGFRAHADEARRSMTAVRQGAEAAKAATVLDGVREGVDVARQGEVEYKAGRFATAARRFLAARERFERAGRAAR
ncbi:MAG TPA: serine/threonine-protein kinase [Vicinamibacteria bacterium]|nr:serine/threonine-protein kinase [Vicinamibacteria bacterium]